MSFSVVKRFGKVAIENEDDRYRLRWKYLGRRFCFAVGKTDTEVALVAAEAKAQQINSDILFDRFDESLARYSHKHAAELAAKKRGLDLREVWERYKQANAKRVAKTTQKNWWSQTDRCLLKLSSDLLLLDNARSAATKMLEFYSPNTVRRLLNDLNAACNWAIEAKLIESNPYSKLKASLPSQMPSNRARECFDPREIKAILKAFRKDEAVSYYVNYVELLALTGFRPEEAIALTWDDVICNESEKTFLRVNKAYSKRELKGTKTHDTRDFPCNEQLVKLLENIPKIPNDNNLVFPSPKKTYIDQHNFLSRQWTPIVKRLVKERKISQYLPTYNLRHSFITRLIQDGLDVATVAKLAGNSPQVIFDHYLAARADIVLPEL